MASSSSSDSWGDRDDDGTWDDGTVTDHERELYERARNAASEAEREGDAQLQAAMAAARVVNQAVVAPTHLNFWCLKFHSDRLEAGYQRKASTNTEYYDYAPLLVKILTCVPHLVLVLRWLWNPSHLSRRRNLEPLAKPELTFYELWSIGALLVCLSVIGMQLIWPPWYRSNRGTTIKYLALYLWLWESLKLFLNTNDMKYVVLEVLFVNMSMSIIHRATFMSHLRLRSYGSAAQAVATVCKAVSVKMCIQILSASLVGHVVGLGLAYLLDKYARKKFLQSLPVWLLEDMAGNRSQAHFYSSYRASLSRQLWSIFYPELLENSQASGQALKQGGAPLPSASGVVAPRRALGGFAGGFGGVSSLKFTGPLSSTISAPSSSGSMSCGESSDTSHDSGTSCGDTVHTVQDISGNGRRWQPSVRTRTVVGQSSYQSHHLRSRAQTGESISRGYY